MTTEPLDLVAPRESWTTLEYVAAMDEISALSRCGLIAKYGPQPTHDPPTLDEWECALRCAGYTAESRGNSYFHLRQEYSAVLARVRAQEELIAELELDRKRLDVLEELRANHRIQTGTNNCVQVWHSGLIGDTRYESFHAAADAEMARSLLTTRTPEQGESEK
jgi:hypothetical protein